MPRGESHDIDPDQLLKAYALGYFPMGRSRDDPKTVWVLPEERGVLLLEKARLPRRLKEFMAKRPFDVRVDEDFSAVISGCAERKPGREETWINAPIEEAYTELFRRGYGHCVACYRDGGLVGGIYGVALGGVFCGESMFSRATNASKVALAHLIDILKEGGFRLLDAQFHTGHLAQFGVEPMPNETYQALLQEALTIQATFAPMSAGARARS